MFEGYPSGQELLIELCNLNLELWGKSPEECARILIRWSMENIHSCYFYGDNVSHLEWNKDDPASYWDVMVNALECYYVHVEEMVQDKRGLATYGQIKDYVLERSGLKVSSLYIAQVKQKHGIIERENYNKPKSEDARQPQCPLEKERAITEALKHFGML